MTVAEYVLLGRTPHLGPLAKEGARDREAAARALARLDLLRVRRAPARDALGRREAARRRRPGARAGGAHRPPRRADRGARHRAPAAGARAARLPARRVRPHARRRDARPHAGGAVRGPDGAARPGPNRRRRRSRRRAHRGHDRRATTARRSTSSRSPAASRSSHDVPARGVRLDGHRPQRRPFIDRIAVASPRASLADLNEAQREAVLHTEGPLLVVAGAGSGRRASSPTASRT